jgi:sulfur carrier protein
VRIIVNGNEQEVPQGTTLAELVERERGCLPAGRGVAVAVDSDVVPRGEWEATVLAEDQRVELVAAIQGGLQ